MNARASALPATACSAGKSTIAAPVRHLGNAFPERYYIVCLDFQDGVCHVPAIGPKVGIGASLSRLRSSKGSTSSER